MMDVKTYEEVFGKPLTIRDLVEGFYEDEKTGSVSAFHGDLNIRPPYQREFVYETKKQQAVVDTILKGYPLNVMYWAKSNSPTGFAYEVMDGQQRIMSICKFVDMQQVYPMIEDGKIKNKTLSEFDDDMRERFLNYRLTVYICDGTDAQKLAWFRTINISGVRLTDQEMRNAIYTSDWVTDAKKYFSDVNGLAYSSEGHISNGHTYGEYVDVIGGTSSEKENAVARQRLLEIALEWATDKYNRDNGLVGKAKINIDEFMRLNKGKPSAIELWRYYEDVIEWVKATFPTYRPIMQKVDWGSLYNEFQNGSFVNVDNKVNIIMGSADEISNVREVYHAVLSGDMHWLNARNFTDVDKRWAYRKQGGRCPYCHKEYDYSQMHGDHIVPWSKGGKTDRDNLQMLCIACNLKKSAYDVGYTPWDSKGYDPFNVEAWDKQE